MFCRSVSSLSLTFAFYPTQCPKCSIPYVSWCKTLYNFKINCHPHIPVVVVRTLSTPRTISFLSFWALSVHMFIYIYATVCVTHAHVLVGVRVDSEYLLALLLTYLLRQSLSLELIANQYCLSSWPVSARKPLYLLSKTGNIGGLCLPRFNVGSGNLNSGVCVWTSYVTMEQLPVFFSFNFNFRISNSSYFSNSLCRITNH